MKKIFLLIPLIVITVTSCGPSQEEVEAAEKVKQDSMAVVMQNTDTVVKEEVKKDSVLGVEVVSAKKAYKQKLAYLQSQYEEACKKLESIKGHKLLRSKHKKEKQIEEQTKVVNSIEHQIAALKNQNK
jgi:hypothetical protein